MNKLADTWTKWTSYLIAPIDGAALAVFRIVFGTIIALDILRHISDGYIHYSFGIPQFWFSFLPFVQPMSETMLHLLFWGMFASAVLVALGLCYRIATAFLCVSLTYIFLLDQTLFLNHAYLICLISLLMAIVPAHTVWSLDRRMEPEKFLNGDSVPRWSMLVLKTQIFLVYFFGAIWKMNPDWLRGIPCEIFMFGSPLAKQLPVICEPWFAKFIALGGIGIDLFVPIFLVIPQTYWLGMVLVVPFHLINHFLFNIGVFPWFMLGTLVLFPPCDWPRKVLAKIAPKSDSDKQFEGSVKNLLVGQPLTTRKFTIATIAALCFFHVYLIIQLVVPLRHLAYPGSVDWTEQGYFFTWRMMLHYKNTAMKMYQTDPRTGVRASVPFEKYLNEQQILRMKWQPELAQLFAHWYADKVERATGVRPIITAKMLASLHSRPWQDLVDPHVDLASAPIGIHAKEWIMPLTSEPVDLPNYQHRYSYSHKTEKKLAAK